MRVRRVIPFFFLLGSEDKFPEKKKWLRGTYFDLLAPSGGF